MQIITSLLNNFKYITYHLYTWAFRFIIIYVGTIPLRYQMEYFFKNRTINEDMLNGLDVHAIFEFVLRGFYDSTSGINDILLVLFGMVALLFFIIDPLIEAGFIGVLHHKDKSKFWSSLSSKGMKMIGLKLILLVPNLIFIAVAIFAMIIIASPNFTLVSLAIGFILIGTFFLFVYKFNDLAKYYVVIKDASPGKAASKSISKVFDQFTPTLIMNAITALLFYIGFALGQMIDDSMLVNSAGMIFIALVIRQVLIFLKQVLRYAYLDATMHMNPLSVKEESTSDDLPPRKDDSGFEFNEMIKET